MMVNHFVSGEFWWPKDCVLVHLPVKNNSVKHKHGRKNEEKVETWYHVISGNTEIMQFICCNRQVDIKFMKSLNIKWYFSHTFTSYAYVTRDILGYAKLNSLSDFDSFLCW